MHRIGINEYFQRNRQDFINRLALSGRIIKLFIQRATESDIEATRVARAYFALISLNDDQIMDAEATNMFLKIQRPDGGWSDPEETAWAVSVISQLEGEKEEAIKKAENWLNSVRYPGGGWGRHPRDQVRIPTTALVITLVPSVATDLDREWVRQAWEKDMASPVQLSYKGGFYLLTVDRETSDAADPLVTSTIAHLAEDQNDNGGFGPWKDHPIGSDPWSTGVVLWGLSKWIDRVDLQVIEKALDWLEKTQLPSGYWPYHYLDEGTSYALIGAVSAMRAMENRK